MFFDIDLQTVKDVEALRAFKLTRNKKVSDAPVDPFEVHYKETHYIEMSDEEIIASAGKVLMYDVECFANYFLVAFRCVNTGRVILLEQFQDETLQGCGNSIGVCDGMCSGNADCLTVGFNHRKLAYIINNFCIVGFNSRNYDLCMCMLAMRGATNKELNEASFKLIVGNMWPAQFEQEYDIKIPYLKHIDLIEVAPLQASLKTYAGRLNCKRMQDLPADPSATLTASERQDVKVYCLNDLCNTELLCKELSPQLSLRKSISEQYHVNVLSKSDAQIAESVIGKEIERITGTWPSKVDIPVGRTYFYRIPKYLHYANPQLQEMLKLVANTPFVVEATGYFTMPEAIANLEIKIGHCVYRMGMGGLHSSEKSVVHKADEDTLLLDRDVASYYPRIILNQSLYPHHLGKNFLQVYNSIVERRLKAKNEGNKVVADSLKITINGSFGKLGNPYSCLYSPDLMIQVTVSGQLCLLLLIDMIEYFGIPIVSANTDGVIIKCPKAKHKQLEDIIKAWEEMTGFETEETHYSAIYSRDVNNYIAVKTDGEVKRKGTYAERGSAGNSPLSRNPENFICNDAVIALLTKEVPIEQTIRQCKDITKFVTVRNVRGGAVKSNQYLGKCIRWYVSTEMKGEINYLISGNKVPNSDCARPLMELPDDFPTDINYDYYITKANEILQDLGVTPKPCSTGRKGKKQPTLFDLS